MYYYLFNINWKMFTEPITLNFLDWLYLESYNIWTNIKYFHKLQEKLHILLYWYMSFYVFNLLSKTRTHRLADILTHVNNYATIYNKFQCPKGNHIFYMAEFYKGWYDQIRANIVTIVNVAIIINMADIRINMADIMDKYCSLRVGSQQCKYR